MQNSGYTDFKPSSKIHFLWGLPILFSWTFSLTLLLTRYGLPIDDSYIYLKYIENLNAGFGYSFNPGEISFGTTSFLYTLICATVSMLLFFTTPLIACQIVGFLSAAGLLWLVQRIVYGQTGNLPLSLIAGFSLAICRPLYFTTPSGLETTFYNAVTLWVVWLGLRRPAISPVWLGFAAGILFLTRPEGLYFTIGFVLAALLYPFVFARDTFAYAIRSILKNLGFYAIGVVLVSLPYLIFVKVNSGYWLPMTFYGKMLNRSEFITLTISERIRQGFWALLEGYTQLLAQDPLPFAFAWLWMLTLISLLVFFFRCGRLTPPWTLFCTRVALFLYLLLPFVYGSVYRVSPMFGGFFIRYIQFLIVIIHIEGFLGLHAILSGLALPNFSKKWKIRITHGALIVLIPFLLYALYIAGSRLPNDREFYSNHVSVNEAVRRSAAEWINQNTPENARVFTSNTGLGAIGAYCNRWIRDEAGLINPDIYPYLMGYLRGQSHWHKMLEYMNHHRIDIITTFPPYGETDRFVQPLVTIEEASLKGTPFERISKIQISKVEFPEQYNLQADFDLYADVIDRSPNSTQRKRGKQVTWQNEPAVMLLANQHALDVRQLLMYPKSPTFHSQLGVEIAESDWDGDIQLTFRVFANYERQREDLYEKQYSITKPGAQILDTVSVDFSEYSERYGFLLYGVELDRQIESGVRVYVMQPRLMGVNPSLLP